MNIDNLKGYSLQNLGKINIILGKNGSGKSIALKELDRGLSETPNSFSKYITPERGGFLKHEPNVESSILSSTGWFNEQLRQNQWSQYKHQSVYQYRKLEIQSLREIEKDHKLRSNFDYTFDTIIERINGLLDRVKIIRDSADFKIQLKANNTPIDPNKISSGESEIISLAIDCFSFQKDCKDGVENILLIDEPDVHLHPDLQVKFANFLKEIVTDKPFKIILATHSTSLLGGFIDYPDAKFDIISFEKRRFEFKNISTIYKKVLPIFGAHPLSNLFNESPIFLVEGEDDLRIWQQAVRSSDSTLKIYPCSVDSVTQMNEYETEIANILLSIYDNPIAYSLRDKDDGPETIDDSNFINRFRLSCRNAENLILTDEVLSNLGSNWQDLKAQIERSISIEALPRHRELLQFKESGYDRKNHQIKSLRNTLIGLTGSEKPWEVAVGQVIGQIKKGDIRKDFSDFKICNFLGTKIVNRLI